MCGFFRVVKEFLLMHTKLGVFCDRIIEAGLVATVVVVPLFFSVYSRMAFGLTKTALVRSIVLVMVIAWLIRTAEAGLRPGTRSKDALGSVWTTVLHTPLALPILILATAYILSTVVSIWPRGSLWGSYDRAQGAYVTLAYMALFPLALTTLRRQEQVDRLVTAALLSSFPVALYGIMQHLHLDPFRWAGLADAVPDRVISTLGNPVFLAAYLMMVIPLSLGRIVTSVTAVREGRVASLSGYLLALCYCILLIAQFLAILFTQTRGAWVGLGVGCLFLALLLATMRRRRAQILAVTLAGIEILLFVVILNLPNTPLEPLRRIPYVDRLGRIFDMESGSGRLRMYVWGAAMRLSGSDPLRTMVGYGPETLGAAIVPHMSQELVRMSVGREGRLPDRSHNEVLDALATTGLIGTAAYFLVLGALFTYGLKALGLVEGSRQKVALITLWLVGGVLLPLAFRAIEGTWRLAGVGVPLGMVVGLLAYLLGHSFFASPGSREGPRLSTQQILIASLLAVEVAHVVEIQFGIAITVTRVFFWLFAALIVVIGYTGERQPAALMADAPPPSRRRRRRQSHSGSGDEGRSPVALSSVGAGRVSFLYYSLVLSLAFLTLGFAFSAPGVGQASLSSNMLLYFAIVCVFGGIIIHVETDVLGGQEVGGDWSPLVYLGTSLAFLLLFLLGLRPFTTVLARGLGGLVTFHLWLLVGVVVLAIWLVWTAGSIPTILSRRPWWLYIPVVVVALFLIVITNLMPLRADMVYARAVALQDADQRIAVLQQALGIAANAPQNASLGRAYLVKARASATVSDASVWLRKAREAFERARELEPVFASRTADLGDLYRTWGELSLRSEDRIERFNKAIGYYAEAGEMSPLQAELSAEELSQTYLLLAEAQAVAGRAELTTAAYEKAMSAAPDSVWGALARGALQIQAGELEAAAEAIEQAIALAPDSYVAHWKLAQVYGQLGKSEIATAEAEQARELAPESLRVNLETILGPL